MVKVWFVLEIFLEEIIRKHYWDLLLESLFQLFFEISWKVKEIWLIWELAMQIHYKFCSLHLPFQAFLDWNHSWGRLLNQRNMSLFQCRSWDLTSHSLMIYDQMVTSATGCISKSSTISIVEPKAHSQVLWMSLGSATWPPSQDTRISFLE